MTDDLLPPVHGRRRLATVLAGVALVGALASCEAAEQTATSQAANSEPTSPSSPARLQAAAQLKAPAKASPTPAKTAPATAAAVAAPAKAPVRVASVATTRAPAPVRSTQAAAAAPAAAKRYQNCDALNVDYPGGVSMPGAVDKRSGGGTAKYKPTVSTALYEANAGKDRDKDRIACEQ